MREPLWQHKFCALPTVQAPVHHAHIRTQSGIVPHAINGGAAFFISPDGSKEGWSESDKAAQTRKEFIAQLRHPTSLAGVDWAQVLIGGDDGEFEVLQSPASGDHAETTPSTTVA